jgi:hypothetical protein
MRLLADEEKHENKYHACVIVPSLTGVDNIGGISVRRVGSTVLDMLAARLLDIPNNFIRTPANKDGAATSGVSLGALRNNDRRECNRLSNSEDGTGDIVAKEE